MATETLVKGRMAYEERLTKARKLEEENRSILATPSPSAGEISPYQIGMMSKREHAQFMDNLAKKNALEAQIKQLRLTNEELGRRETAKATEEKSGRILQLQRQLEDLRAVGVGKSGKMRPSYQRTIDIAEAELHTLTGNPGSPKPTKEPWEMTQKEYISDWEKEAGVKQVRGEAERLANLRVAKYSHQAKVKGALSEGKPVPAEVLKDYPELGKKEPKAEAPEGIKKSGSLYVAKDRKALKELKTLEDGAQVKIGAYLVKVKFSDGAKHYDNAGLLSTVEGFDTGKIQDVYVRPDYIDTFLSQVKQGKAEKLEPTPKPEPGKKEEPKGKTETTWQKAQAEVSERIEAIENEWVAKSHVGTTKEQQARVDATIVEVAKKHHIPASTLRKAVLWEATAARPESRERMTAEQVEEWFKSQPESAKSKVAEEEKARETSRREYKPHYNPVARGGERWKLGNYYGDFVKDANGLELKFRSQEQAEAYLKRKSKPEAPAKAVPAKLTEQLDKLPGIEKTYWKPDASTLTVYYDEAIDKDAANVRVQKYLAENALRDSVEKITFLSTAKGTFTAPTPKPEQEPKAEPKPKWAGYSITERIMRQLGLDSHDARTIEKALNKYESSEQFTETVGNSPTSVSNWAYDVISKSGRYKTVRAMEIAVADNLENQQTTAKELWQSIPRVSRRAEPKAKKEEPKAEGKGEEYTLQDYDKDVAHSKKAYQEVLAKTGSHKEAFAAENEIVTTAQRKYEAVHRAKPKPHKGIAVLRTKPTKQSDRAIAIDRSLLARQVVSVEDPRWLRRPNRFDVRGIDTPRRGRIVAGVAYADRGKQRLSRKHHRGFRRIKFT